MRKGILEYGGFIFDKIEKSWEGPTGHRRSASFLMIFFIGSVLLIELNRQGWLPVYLAELAPRNHLVAIAWVFTLILTLEVVGLALAISKSVSISVGKQLEILSLILLRSTFKEISYLDEPLLWEQVEPLILPILSTALGALAIFAMLAVFYRIKKSFPIILASTEKNRFILAKKTIALFLLSGFLFIVFYDLFAYIYHGTPETVFEKFYTLLIFTDVLLVLLSLRCNTGYLTAFRNSGFAVVTVLIRLALIAPLFISALLGAATALFALGIIYIYNRYMLQMDPEEIRRSKSCGCEEGQ